MTNYDDIGHDHIGHRQLQQVTIGLYA